MTPRFTRIVWVVGVGLLGLVAFARVQEPAKSDNRREQLLTKLSRASNAEEWQNAAKHVDQLLRDFAGDSAVLSAIRQCWLQQAQSELKAGNEAAARRALDHLNYHFLHVPQAEPVRKALRTRAEQLLNEARNTSGAASIEKLLQAQALWPRLPGLRDALADRRRTSFVIYVAVRQLPEFLSPATAATQTEQLALDLVFERMVRPKHDDARGERYEAGLAARLPDVDYLSRRVHLRRDAYWSDGERVTPADVRHSILLATNPPTVGRNVSWHDLVEVPRIEANAFTVDFQLRQQFFAPLAALSFPVLPQNFRGKPLARGDDPDFARQPMGSGPFQYLGRQEAQGRTYAVFAANPQFVRAERPDLPRARQIRMFAWNDFKDLQALPHPVHIVLGIPADKMTLASELNLRPTQSALSRRIHFLAVNHRVTSLTNVHLRRFLAAAIDREQILMQHFRGGVPPAWWLEYFGAGPVVASMPWRLSRDRHHQALNGPYPADTWACCAPPHVPARLFDVDLARSWARQLPKDKIELTLKFPQGDARVVGACQSLAEQIARRAADAGTHVRLHPVPLPMDQLRDAVYAHDYHLAYFHHHFPDDCYWLWPLFDPQPDAVRPGGGNYLGYDNDAKLQSLFRAAMNQPHFASLQELTHSIHAHLVDTMPLIPLWQLHEHFALHSQLRMPHLDAARLFAGSEEWTLDAR